MLDAALPGVWLEVEGALEPLLDGAALDPLLDWPPDVLGALDEELAPELGVDGVADDELGESFLSASADPEVEAGGVAEELEELEESFLFTSADPDIELEDDAGGVLVPAEDEDEGAGVVALDDGVEGAGAVVLDEDEEPAEGVRAFGPSTPLSQP